MNYIDQYGRWHTKPVTVDNPLPTNNAYIYSFYAKMVGIEVCIYDFSEEVLDQVLDLDETVITRHPGDNTPPISHDEYVGLAGMDKDTAEDIVDFGEKNYFQYCDVPGYTPIPFRKVVIDDVLAAYEGLANDEEKNVRKAVVKYPALYPFAFWHRPEQQYFYYRCAGRTPGTFRTLYFIIASLVSILSKDPGVMFGFKALKFKQLGPNLVEKALIKLHDKYGRWKEACIKYFPEDHPILEKVLAQK